MKFEWIRKLKIVTIYLFSAGTIFFSELGYVIATLSIAKRMIVYFAENIRFFNVNRLLSVSFCAICSLMMIQNASTHRKENSPFLCNEV